MADKNLDGSGLSEVWVRAAQLVKRFTGAVNLTKGDLQTQVDTKITGTAISSSSAITTQGEYALDAREKNASVEGTLANQISTLNSNLGAKADKTQLSNPNLLDNPWFNVNSRGQDEYDPNTSNSTSMYAMDRWKAYFWNATNRKISITDNGIEMQSEPSDSKTQNNVEVYQDLSNDIVKYLRGKTVNLSVLVNVLIEGSLFMLTLKCSTDNATSYSTKINLQCTQFNTFTLLSKSINIPDNVTNIRIDFGYIASQGGAKGNHHAIVKAVKLEIGSVSTLNMDTAPDVEQERLKCMLSTADSDDTYANKGALTQDLWNSTKTYVVGEYCIYNGSMWKCLAQNSGVEPTEGDTWTATSIGAELASLQSKVDALSA